MVLEVRCFSNEYLQVTPEVLGRGVLKLSAEHGQSIQNHLAKSPLEQEEFSNRAAQEKSIQAHLTACWESAPQSMENTSLGYWDTSPENMQDFAVGPIILQRRNAFRNWFNSILVT